MTRKLDAVGTSGPVGKITVSDGGDKPFRSVLRTKKKVVETAAARPGDRLLVMVCECLIRKNVDPVAFLETAEMEADYDGKTLTVVAR